MARITVALLGSKTDPFADNEVFGSEAERTKKWADRDKVEIEVHDDETLSAILSRAGTQLGVRPHEGRGGAPAPTFIALYAEVGDRQFAAVSSLLSLVDDAGRVRWGVPYDSATYRELLRATEAKAVAGDPGRLYYCTYPAIGNGVLITLAQYASAIYTVLDVLATIEGGVGLGERVRTRLAERLGASKKALDAHGFDWERRNGDPYTINLMLGDRPWHEADLAALLGCAEDEAKAVLWSFGFAEGDGGLWRRGADETAQILDTLLDEIQMSYSLGHGEFENTLKRRVRHQLTTGERAPRPFMDKERFGDRLAEPDDDEFREEFDGEFGDDDLDERLSRLPLDHIRLQCACGKEGCSAVAGFGIANGGLKIGFTAPTDHFVLDPTFMTEVAMQVDLAIDEAKAGNGDEPAA